LARKIRSDLRSTIRITLRVTSRNFPKVIDARAIEPGTAAGSPNAELGRGGGAEAGGAQNCKTEKRLHMCVVGDRPGVRPRRPEFSPATFVAQNLGDARESVVYQSLLDVIAKTNRAANATRMSNAAIPEIDELSLGLRAAKGSRTSGRLNGKNRCSDSSRSRSRGWSYWSRCWSCRWTRGRWPASRFTQGGGPNGGQMTDEQEKVYLLSGRYISADGKPIPFPFGAAAAPAPEKHSSARSRSGRRSRAARSHHIRSGIQRLPVRMVYG